jgi:hypothetical protein
VVVIPTPTPTSTPTITEVDSLYWESEIITPEPENKNEPIREVPRLPMVGLKTFQRNVRNSKRRNF